MAARQPRHQRQHRLASQAPTHLRTRQSWPSPGPRPAAAGSSPGSGRRLCWWPGLRREAVISNWQRKPSCAADADCCCLMQGARYSPGWMGGGGCCSHQQQGRCTGSQPATVPPHLQRRRPGPLQPALQSPPAPGPHQPLQRRLLRLRRRRPRPPRPCSFSCSCSYASSSGSSCCQQQRQLHWQLRLQHLLQRHHLLRQRQHLLHLRPPPPAAPSRPRTPHRQAAPQTRNLRCTCWACQRRRQQQQRCPAAGRLLLALPLLQPAAAAPPRRQGHARLRHRQAPPGPRPEAPAVVPLGLQQAAGQQLGWGVAAQPQACCRGQQLLQPPLRVATRPAGPR
jgi:hypothetical protein